MPQQGSSVIIVGAGFGGVGMGIELLRSGFEDFLILEKADDLGGVWRDNVYPGAGCDIPSPYYSFSYEPNPGWPRRFSLQPDILDYLRRVVAKYGLDKHIRFGTEVASAEHDGSHWLITTGEGNMLRAKAFVPAVGQLSRPVFPPIPGIDRFAGPSFHSAHWDHDLDLHGKRVAVVGTGASAIQFVPHVQRQASQVTVFQRSAPWIVPKPDTGYGKARQWLFTRLPPTLAAERLYFWVVGEVAAFGLAGNEAVATGVRWFADRLRRKQIADPALRAKVTPDYHIGCKRVLFSNDYLPALASSNVDLVTAPVDEITETGVRAADGTHVDVDVIIYGTGFAATDFLAPMRITGTDGAELNDVWRDGARAYLGISVPGFPNMFCMYGPNTNLGSGSIVYMLERQARYIRQAVEFLSRHPETPLSARTDVERDYDREIQDRLRASVWSRCQSWYRLQGGRVPTNWPGTVSEYSRRTRALDLSDYDLRAKVNT